MIKPLVSVCILNYNGEIFIERCIASVLRTSYPRYEIILVDNASSDNSLKVIKDTLQSVNDVDITVITLSTNIGYAGGHNTSAKIAKGKYLAFLNVDTEVEPDWLSSVDLMDCDPSIAAVQPLIMDYEDRTRIQNMGMNLTRFGTLQILGKGMHYHDLTECGAMIYEIFSALGASFIVRKEQFDALGGFDEEMFMYFEESDLCWRLWLEGYKVMFFHNTILNDKVFHRAYGTIPSDFKGGNYFSRNRVLSMIKNLQTRNLPLAIAHLLFALMTRICTPKEDISFLKELLRLLPSELRRRRYIQLIRKTKDSVIFELASLHERRQERRK